MAELHAAFDKPPRHNAQKTAKPDGEAGWQRPDNAGQNPGGAVFQQMSEKFFGNHADPSRLLKKSFYTGCSKMRRCKARTIMRNEAYFFVRRSDE
jgi:hypothetical protein